MNGRRHGQRLYRPSPTFTFSPYLTYLTYSFPPHASVRP